MKDAMGGKITWDVSHLNGNGWLVKFALGPHSDRIAMQLINMVDKAETINHLIVTDEPSAEPVKASEVSGLRVRSE